MIKIIILFSSALISMLAIDFVWLLTMSKKFYAGQIGHLLADTPKLLPAGLFYLIYILGLTLLVTWPAINQSQNLVKVFILGCLFGLVAYATYDLTNQATLKDWPVLVTVVDLVWGALLTGSVSVIAVFITKYFS